MRLTKKLAAGTFSKPAPQATTVRYAGKVLDPAYQVGSYACDKEIPSERIIALIHRDVPQDGIEVTDSL